MKTVYSFADFRSVSDAFQYVYSPICRKFDTFVQEEGHISNRLPEIADGSTADFPYISVLSKKKYAVTEDGGLCAVLHCSFDSFGAPLIVFGDNFSMDSEGRFIYGLHFEVVAYENGFNVWHIVPDPARTERPIRPTKSAFREFRIGDGETAEIRVRFFPKRFLVTVNGVEAEVPMEDLPDRLHVGFTACEGINRFYDFSIEEP